jgi:hypothetical protein
MILARLGAFGAFWYDFIIGDDWQVAFGVVVTLTLTDVLSRNTSAPLWWLVPAAVVIMLPLSLWRATRRTA